MSDQANEPAAPRSSRAALLIATSTYADPTFNPLVAPEPDARGLAEVLGKPEIGAFDVQTVVNQPAHLVTKAIEKHLITRRPDDFALLHISCHGVKDADGQFVLCRYRHRSESARLDHGFGRISSRPARPKQGADNRCAAGLLL